MAKIILRMEGGTLNLTADGNIYRVPVYQGSVPVIEGVRVRKTVPAGEPSSLELPQGRYQYRFEVKHGDGKYFIKATYHTQETPFASTDELDAQYQEGNILSFEVRA
ncbi:hypothetical protein [Sorangium sp. So ce542]|uniref:hypothetical protein n=1 Tax=Sorangium sp. So ce542 TaxID=3133316 RepID=UPI003F647560